MVKSINIPEIAYSSSQVNLSLNTALWVYFGALSLQCRPLIRLNSTAQSWSCCFNCHQQLRFQAIWLDSGWSHHGRCTWQRMLERALADSSQGQGTPDSAEWCSVWAELVLIRFDYCEGRVSSSVSMRSLCTLAVDLGSLNAWSALPGRDSWANRRRTNARIVIWSLAGDGGLWSWSCIIR